MLTNPLVIESLRSVVAPALGGVVLLLLIWRPTKRDCAAPPIWACAAGLALAMIAGRMIATGWPGFWPLDTTRRLWIVAIVGGAVAATGSLEKLPRWFIGLLWSIACVFSAWALTAHKARNGTWDSSEAWMWVAMWALVLGIGAWSMSVFVKSRDPRWGALVVSVFAGAASVTAALGVTVTIAQAMGVVSAWFGIIFTVALLRPSMRLTGSGALAGLLLQSCLCLTYVSGQADPPRLGLGLALGAPLILAAGPISRKIRSLPAPGRAILEAGAVIVVLVGAALTTHEAVSSPGDAIDPAADLYGSP